MDLTKFIKRLIKIGNACKGMNADELSIVVLQVSNELTAEKLGKKTTKTGGDYEKDLQREDY